MEGPLKELAKLEKLAAGTPSAKGKAPSVDQSLDALLDSLRNAKERFQEGTGSQAMLETLAKTVEEKKKEVDDRQKEVYNALAKFGKALDKVRRNQTPINQGGLLKGSCRNFPTHFRHTTLCLPPRRLKRPSNAQLLFISCEQGSSRRQRCSFVLATSLPLLKPDEV